MTNQPPQNQPSLNTTHARNSVGGVDDVITQDVPFTLFGELINGVPTLDVTFDNPVQLATLEIDNWFPTLPDGIQFLYIYQPLGILLTSLNTSSSFALSSINPSTPISRLIIIAGVNAPQFEVKFEAIFIYNADNTEAISGSGTAGNAGAGDQFILDGLQNQITEILHKVDDQDTFIHDGLVNNLEAVKASNDTLNATLDDELNFILEANIQNSKNLNQTIKDALNEHSETISNSFTGLSDLIKLVSPGEGTNLFDSIINIINQVINLLGQRITDATSINGRPLFDEVNNANTSIVDTLVKQSITINKLLKGQFSNLDAFYDELQQNGADINFLTTLQNSFTIFFLIAEYLKAKTSTIGIALQQVMLSKDTPNINDINTNVSAYIRGFKTLEQLQTDLAKYGLNKDRVNELLSTRALLLGLADIKTALQRGLISEVEHDTLLSQNGLAPGNIELLKSVYPLLPSPTDITHMADKHIFAPDIPQIFGQNSELDSGYTASMELWGIDSDWTKKLWASHWSLPGLQETFDLWHRGFITDDELNVYFKLTDILPFFREKLKLLSHQLIGRVDIRRFYHVGVYTQQDVHNAFIKLGYSADDAQKQTDFTVENDRLSELPKQVKIRTLTESMVVKAYKEGILSQQDAINRLGQVGYLPQDAALILQLETQTASIAKVANKTQYYHDKTVNLVLSDYAKGVFGRTDARNYLIAIGVPQAEADQELYYADLERITQLKSLVINHIRTAYTKGQIDKANATNLMLSFGFGMSEIELLFEELDIIRMLRNKELTLAQITSLAKKQIITPQEFATELANIGYNDTHINWLLLETFGAP